MDNITLNKNIAIIGVYNFQRCDYGIYPEGVGATRSCSEEPVQGCDAGEL